MKNYWVAEGKDFAPWSTSVATRTMLQIPYVVLKLSLKILYCWEDSVGRGNVGMGINDREYHKRIKHLFLK